MHLNQLRAVPVSLVKSRVQRCHRVALASSENGIDLRAVIQEDFARVQVTVQSRDVERRFAVVRGNVQRARSPLRQPSYQFDSAGRNGLVSYPRASHGSGVKRSAVLTQNLQRLQLAFSRGAERWSEKTLRSSSTNYDSFRLTEFINTSIAARLLDTCD